MIVITGPGRSGTSVLARLYDALGFDIGGTWNDEIRAGLEDKPVVDLNKAILEYLDMAPLGRYRGGPAVSAVVGKRTGSLLKKIVPARMRKRFRKEVAKRGDASLAYEIPWDRVPAAAAHFAPRMAEQVARKRAVKDPLFSWTLPVWFAADAGITHVVATSRDIDAMLDSRKDAAHLMADQLGEAKASMQYALDLLESELPKSGVPFVMLRFPDFLKDADALYAQLPLPGITSDAFRSVFDAEVKTPTKSV